MRAPSFRARSRSAASVSGLSRWASSTSSGTPSGHAGQIGLRVDAHRRHAGPLVGRRDGPEQRGLPRASGSDDGRGQRVGRCRRDLPEDPARLRNDHLGWRGRRRLVHHAGFPSFGLSPSSSVTERGPLQGRSTRAGRGVAQARSNVRSKSLRHVAPASSEASQRPRIRSASTSATNRWWKSGSSRVSRPVAAAERHRVLAADAAIVLVERDEPVVRVGAAEDEVHLRMHVLARAQLRPHDQQRLPEPLDGGGARHRGARRLEEPGVRHRRGPLRRRARRASPFRCCASAFPLDPSPATLAEASARSRRAGRGSRRGARPPSTAA